MNPANRKALLDNLHSLFQARTLEGLVTSWQSAGLVQTSLLLIFCLVYSGIVNQMFKQVCGRCMMSLLRVWSKQTRAY